jgi:hypothetical protein
MLRVINGGRSKEALQEAREMFAEVAALDAAGEFGEPNRVGYRFNGEIRKDPEFLQIMAAELLREGLRWREHLAEAERRQAARIFANESKSELRAQVKALKLCLDNVSKELLSMGLLLFDPNHAA